LLSSVGARFSFGGSSRRVEEVSSLKGGSRQTRKVFFFYVLSNVEKNTFFYDNYHFLSFFEEFFSTLVQFSNGGLKFSQIPQPY
jgi:hypothetical protein